MPASRAEIFWTALLSLILIGIGVVYLVRQWQRRRPPGDSGNLSPADRDYFERQARRRRHGSILLILVGAALPGGLKLLDPLRTPRLFGGFWMAILVGILGMFTLALLDVFAIRRYARRHRQRIEEDKRIMIGRQIEAFRTQGNGKPRENPFSEPEPE